MTVFIDTWGGVIWREYWKGYRLLQVTISYSTLGDGNDAQFSQAHGHAHECRSNRPAISQRFQFCEFQSLLNCIRAATYYQDRDARTRTRDTSTARTRASAGRRSSHPRPGLSFGIGASGTPGCRQSTSPTAPLTGPLGSVCNALQACCADIVQVGPTEYEPMCIPLGVTSYAKPFVTY